MIKIILILLIAMYIKADNTTIIDDHNEAITIKQKSKNLGINSIVIGDNNQKITINQKIEIKNFSNKVLSDIKNSLNNLSQNRDKIASDFTKLLAKKELDSQTEIDKLYAEYNKIITSNENTQERVKHLELNIENVIDANNLEIQKLKKRIENMEDDISFLMNEFNQGNLDVLSFYTVHIDAVYISSVLYKGAGVGYERLYNSSILQSLSLIANISTLAGVEKNAIEDIDKQFYLFDIGVKKPFSAYKNLYGKSGIGYLWGDEKSLYFKLAIGIEKYNKKNKLGVELGYFGVFEKQEKIVTTHRLGSAESRTNKEFQHGISFLLSISF